MGCTRSRDSLQDHDWDWMKFTDKLKDYELYYDSTESELGTIRRNDCWGKFLTSCNVCHTADKSKMS